MHNKGGKKNTARVYPTESLMARALFGLLLVAAGVLVAVALFGNVRGTLFSLLKSVSQGIAGTLCIAIPVLLIWGGVLFLISSRRSPPLRTYGFILCILLCLTAMLTLISNVGTTPFWDYLIALNNAQNPPVVQPAGYTNMLASAYRFCASNGAFTGALGMLLAWPLRTYIGMIGGVTVTGLLCLVLLFCMGRFNIAFLTNSIAQKSKERAQRAAQEKQRREYEDYQRAVQEQAAKIPSPAYERRGKKAPVQTVPPQMPVAAIPPQPYTPVMQQPFYDETILPDAPPDAWKPPVPKRKPKKEPKINLQPSAAQSYPGQIAEEPAPVIADDTSDRAARKASQRMEEIRKRKAELQRQIYGDAPSTEDEATASVKVEPLQTTKSFEATQLKPAVHAEAEPQPDRHAAYKRPTVARQQTLPMSGKKLDTPELILPEKKRDVEDHALPEKKPYEYPTLNMLTMLRSKPKDTSTADALNAERLEKTLESFSIPARVERVTHGPAVTRFELGLLSSGVNIKRIMGITDNIAMELQSNGAVRIEVPIPGTNLFGIEVPNDVVETVTLADVLTSAEMSAAGSPLAVPLGRDIAGRAIVCDLAKMPHLLIAGQTGSGKSVCINSIINSLLFRASPKDVRMIMIDPKVVELQCYNVVPHLLIPVVSDPHKASGALAWAVAEMLDRYHKMEQRGVRELSAFNQKLKPGEEKLPRIVIIIDELADLMLACKKEVEESIIRLAQLARAAGIHMIVATQRPTVNVITGLIKANIPSRIAFTVTSSVDSRTILDQVGAERLLGNGDMLYAPTGAKAPVRVQGCYVSDSEIERVVTFIGEHSETEFDPDVLEKLAEDSDSTVSNADDAESGVDPLLPEAIELAITDGQSSISMLQRRMKIGYARAGRLVDAMTLRGVISKSQGSKPRETIMTREEYERIKESFVDNV